MNASRLREILDHLIAAEDETKFQAALSALSSHLAQLAQQPQALEQQTAYASALTQLRQAEENLRAKFEPTQRKAIEELGAAPHFLDDIAGQIDAVVRENPIAPTVAHQKVEQITSQRQAYIKTIRELRERLDQVGIKPTTAEPGTAQLGFTLPRSLFDDNLEGLINELREIRFIIRGFSEVATGSSEPIVVEQISTSDPLFFFGLNPVTVAMIASAVTWALDAWKKVEEIRKLRAETRKVDIETQGEVVDLLDKSITKKIDAAIDHKVAELLANTGHGDGRGREIGTHLHQALESLFARIERGMTVEVRFLPPPGSERPADGETTAADDGPRAFEQLRELSSKLVFPQIASEPVLELPRPAEQNGAAADAAQESPPVPRQEPPTAFGRQLDL